MTQDRPKGLTPLRGKPLVARQCEALRAAGATEIGIVTGYRAESLAPYADRTFHNDRWAETQMVQSMAMAAEWLSQAPLIVSYSDIFYEPETVGALAEAEADLAISYDPDWETQWSGRFEDPLDDAETFRLAPGRGGRSVLREIGRRPRSLAEVEGQYMGLLRFTPSGWNAAQQVHRALSPEDRDSLTMTALLDLLVGRRMEIQAIPSVGPWGEIDSVEDLTFFESNAPMTV
ncbi:phosphocholine cytidylyltransferase family protein [Jannaschia sp. S6380]|nr:phosphocholine cytidylyltransferase family protein [Jannaschia sp. S6380]